MKKFLITILVLVPFVAIGIVWALPYGRSPLDKATGNGTLVETDVAASSSSQTWWLKSGGKMSINGGEWQSIQGKLASSDNIRKAYLRKDPLDTDNGFYPQNIFKLISRSGFLNPVQEMHFSINNINLSPSPNRSGINGVFMLMRYVDANKYYYAGLQTDGTAVIKKRLGIDSFMLAEKKVFDYASYDRDQNPNLLPVGSWIGLKTVVTTVSGAANIKLYGDISGTGEWQLLAEATDGGSYGEVINGKASVGIRADFMDISFSSYKVSEP